MSAALDPLGTPSRLTQRLKRARVWIAAAFALAIGLSLWGASGLRIDPSPQRIFESRGEDFDYLQKVTQAFGRDDDLIVFHVHLPQGVFSPEGVSFLRDFHDRLASVESLATVDDLTNALVILPQAGPQPLLQAGPLDAAALERARALAADSPLLRGRLVSDDGKAAVIVARVESQRIKYDDLLEPVEACLALVESQAPPEGAKVSVTGIPVARVLIAKRLFQDQLTFLPICALAFLLILWALFRDLRVVLLPLIGVGIALLFTVGLLGACDAPIDIINNVLPVLIFVIGISDAIHLLIRYRHELVSGQPQWEALTITLRHLLVACLLTSGTTAIGFGSLTMARIEILKRFGIFAAAGVLLAYVVVVVFVPLVLSYLEPRLPPAGEAADKRIADASVRLGRWVLRRRYAVIGASALVLLACVGFATQVREENNVYEAFSPDDPVVLANQRLERDFAGMIPVSLVVEWSEGRPPFSPEALAYLASLEASLQEQGLRPLSLLDFLREVEFARSGTRALPASQVAVSQSLLALRMGLARGDRATVLTRLVAEEARMLRLTAFAHDEGARVLQGRFRAIEAELAKTAPEAERLGLRVRLSGDGPVASDGVNQLITDLFESLLLAFAIILPIMCLLLRSFRAGLISMIPNVAPLLLTLGWMGLVGLDLRVTTVIVFTVSLGLAVDDTIHFMVRFREEWKLEGSQLPAAPDAEQLDAAYAAALERTYAGTGGAILTTTILLALGFGALLFSRFPISRMFALCMEITVVGALVADLFLLPACLIVFKPFAPPDRIEPREPNPSTNPSDEPSPATKPEPSEVDAARVAPAHDLLGGAPSAGDDAAT